MRTDVWSVVLAVILSTGAHAQSDAGGIAYSKTDAGTWTATSIPPTALRYAPTTAKPVVPFSRPPASIIAERLAAIVERGSPDERVELIMTFRDGVRVPFFPKLDPQYDRTHPENVRLQEYRDGLVAQLIAEREGTYRRRSHAFAALQVQTRETFWLADIMAVTAPLRAVPALATMSDVLRIDLALVETPPPDVADGRALINSDPLFNFWNSQQGGFAPRIALIDTGSPMPLTHAHFTPRNQIIELEKDCARTSDAACTQQLVGWDPTDNCNHGTPSAGILTSRHSNTYRGVTAFRLGSYRAYSATCGATVAIGARAIQAAVSDGYPIMLVEIQAEDPETGALAATANQAFNAGVAVIAPSGNSGETTTPMVRSPAVAHNVIAVGAMPLHSAVPATYNSRGPTTDGRIKPDVLAPTDTTAASTNGFVVQYGGTSGAAPYAAGAAALVGAWWNRGMSLTSWVIPPGQIYAALIDAGTRPNFDNNWGAGRIRMMDPSWLSGHGEVTLPTGNGNYYDVYLTQMPVGVTVKAAIWWSDPAVDLHNDIDLTLWSYAGWFQSRNGIPEVFEKVQYGPVQSPSTWYIRINGYSVPSGPQRVFYSWHAVP